MDGALNSSRYDGGGNRRRGGGGGRHHHHSHYGGRRQQHHHRHHRRGPRPPGNRYGATPQTKPVDPQTAMMQQLSAMVSRVGEYNKPEEEASNNENQQEESLVRSTAVSKNISDLSAVLTNPNNAQLFLKFNKESNDPQQEVGHLVILIINCVSALPLTTPAYAGLTLCLQEKAPQDNYSGLCERSVLHAMRVLSQQLDKLLLENDATKIYSALHVLRYLVLLENMSMVQSVSDLLQNLVTAATNTQNQHVACILALLVLSTIPYMRDTTSNTMEQLVEPLETSVLEKYTSAYWPGLGKSSLLLKQEQLEEEEEEEEDSDDDDEEQDSSAAGQRCDTLQDLFRSCKSLLQQEDETQFMLLTDSPWLGLVVADNKSMQEEEEEKEASASTETLVYTGEPIKLELSDCRSISSLLKQDDSVQLQCFSLDGIAFGRLPIFGAPSQEDDDEEEDEAMETNEQLQAYQKGFTSLDRYFLSDTVRDCLFSHKSTVSDSGLERGSAKDTALQIWAVSNVFGKREGIEYGMIETLLSLIVQSNAGTRRHFYVSKVLLELTRLQPSVMPQALVVAVSNLVVDYLPSLVPSARASLSAWFAFHLTNTDYQWPAGYWQHWTPYVVALQQDKRNSRGEFVVRALQIMASNLSSVAGMCTNCLPAGSVLIESLLESTEEQGEDSDVVASILTNLEERLWDMNEDPDTTRAYMVGDEVSETYSGDGAWWRTCLVLRALLRPAKRHKESMMQTIKRAREQSQENQSDDDMMVVEEDSKRDVLTDLIDVLVRYRPVLLATLARDSQDFDEKQQQGEGAKKDESAVLVEGEAYLLKQLQAMTGYSGVVMAECVTCLLRQRIISGMAVLNWALGDFDSQDTRIVQRWWEMATMMFRVGIAVEMADSDSAIYHSANDIGMVIDGEDSSEAEDPSSKLMKQLVEYAAPLVQYTTQRVCSILADMDNDQGGKRKHTPVEVDLVEGVKQFVVYTHNLLVSESLKRTKGNDNDATDSVPGKLRTALSESNISGSNLATMCRSSEKSAAAIDLLAQILELI